MFRKQQHFTAIQYISDKIAQTILNIYLKMPIPNLSCFWGLFATLWLKSFCLNNQNMMRRRLRDSTENRRHCPSEVRGEIQGNTKKNLHAKKSKLWRQLCWLHPPLQLVHGGDSVAVYCCWLCYLIDSCQLRSSLLLQNDLKHPTDTDTHHTFNLLCNKKSTAELCQDENEWKDAKWKIQLSDKGSAPAASALHSQIQAFAYSRPSSCDWLGGSVMLAVVSFASSHCSATLTVTFDCTYSFISRFDQQIQAGFWDVWEFCRREWGLFWSTSSGVKVALQTLIFDIRNCSSALLSWVAGRQCLVSWLVECVCQLTCCCPPADHLKPHQQLWRTSVIST